MTAIDPNTGQLIELAYDPATSSYILNDGGGAGGSLIVSQAAAAAAAGGKSLLKPELAQHLAQQSGGGVMYRSSGGGSSVQQSSMSSRSPFAQPTSSASDARWIQQNTARGGKVLPRKPMGSSAGGGLVVTSATPTGGVVLSSGGAASSLGTVTGLGSRFTPSSAVVSSGGGGMMGERENMRLAAAMAGSSGRGRPRGRRPLRGQFPVVPIDMVRQLGIEQQVILQPAAPVAMRNKGVLCRPLSMSRKTQVEPHSADAQCQTEELASSLPIPREQAPSKVETAIPEGTGTTAAVEPIIKGQPIFIPIPVPIYLPIPVRMFSQPVPVPMPLLLPCPLPLALLIDEPEKATKFAADVLATDQSTVVTEVSSLEQTTKAGEEPTATVTEEQVNTGDEQGSKLVSVVEEQKPVEQEVPAAVAKESVPVPPSTAGQKRSAPLIVTSASSSTTIVAPFSQSSSPPSKRPRPPSQTPANPVISDSGFRLKFSYGINAWRHWVHQKNTVGGSVMRAELVQMSATELNQALASFVREVRKPNNESYVADSIFYLCLGIQEYLNENGCQLNIFCGPEFVDFSAALDNILAHFQPRISADGLLICRIEEEHLWESKQLGTDTPQVLLFTLVYYNTKHLNLRNGESHRALAFDHFTESTTGLRYQPPAAATSRTDPVELLSNTEDTRACPRRLFKFYLEKCPKSTRNSSDRFYLAPAAAGGAWFASDPLDQCELQVMLNRIKMVKEIQEVFMNSGQGGVGEGSY